MGASSDLSPVENITYMYMHYTRGVINSIAVREKKRLLRVRENYISTRERGFRARDAINQVSEREMYTSNKERCGGRDGD